MITISINGAQRSLGDADAGWIRKHFEEAERGGRVPCIRVAFHTTDLNMNLQTQACGAAGGGGRPPNAHERKVFELWEMEGLGAARINVQHLVDFAERVKRLAR